MDLNKSSAARKDSRGLRKPDLDDPIINELHADDEGQRVDDRIKPRRLDAADKPHDPRLPALGARWLAPPGEGDASAAFRAHRLALGVFEGVEELGQDQILWLEANAQELSGVDYDKGCYVGQENTARMHYRNKVNRRLVAVPLEQADEKRQRAALPDLGLSIELQRVEAIDPATLPGWLATAIAAQAAE